MIRRRRRRPASGKATRRFARRGKLRSLPRPPPAAHWLPRRGIPRAVTSAPLRRCACAETCPRSHCGPRVTAERAPNGEAARGEANEAAVGPDSCEAAVRCVAWRRVAARGGRGPQANAALRVVGGGCGAGVGQPRGQRVRLRRRAVLLRGARGHPVPGGRRLLRELLLCRLAPRPTARRAQPQPQPLGVPFHADPRGNSLLRGRLMLCRNLRLRCHQSLQAPQQRARLRGVPGGALPSAAVAARARARSHAHGAPGRPPAALPHRRARRTAALLRIARCYSGRGGKFRASRKRTQRRSCTTTTAAAAAATAAEAARDVTRPHTAAGGRASAGRPRPRGGQGASATSRGV